MRFVNKSHCCGPIKLQGSPDFKMDVINIYIKQKSVQRTKKNRKINQSERVSTVRTEFSCILKQLLTAKLHSVLVARSEAP